ncbi:hypothetical protein BKA63DRAFT_175916 [Paraphoma chrysanthemicola]|nr:hypothetical protein BKA63DRAFT_175916 [Paraphoma chrysanthemicola]
METLPFKIPQLAPLSWDIYATIYGEPRMPFTLHVQPERLFYSTRTFPLFPNLPIELQLHIIQFCNCATLFQLMQVCTTTRKEAQKLFWSDPEIWNVIGGTWLLSGGFTSDTCYDIDALGNLQQIEVDFGDEVPLCTVDSQDDGILRCAPGEFTLQDQQQQIRDFWQVLQQRLPRATHVVLSHGFPQPPGTPLPPAHRMISEQCPPNITAYVSLLQTEAGYKRRVHRSLWKYGISNSNTRSTIATWVLVTPTWTRKSVLPPPKKFTGPAGAYSYFAYCSHRDDYLHEASCHLHPQATDMYYKHNYYTSLLCPETLRDMRAELLHKTTTCTTVDSSPDQDVLPLNEVFSTEYASRVERLRQQTADLLANMRIAWAEEGSQQRSDTKHAFLHQLQHDPLYATEKTPEESMIWYNYQLTMDEELYNE